MKNAWVLIHKDQVTVNRSWDYCISQVLSNLDDIKTIELLSPVKYSESIKGERLLKYLFENEKITEEQYMELLL